MSPQAKQTAIGVLVWGAVVIGCSLFWYAVLSAIFGGL
jgi:hypothetical protein